MNRPFSEYRPNKRIGKQFKDLAIGDHFTSPFSGQGNLNRLRSMANNLNLRYDVEFEIVKLGERPSVFRRR